MSTPEVQELVAAMTELKTGQSQTVAEVKRLSAAQDLLAADATPWASWVNEKLAAQQAAADVVSQKMMEIVTGATTALDELRGRLSDAEKKPTAHKPKWEMSGPKDMEPSTFGGKDDLWAKFKEDLMDFADAVHPGIKVQLEWTLRQREEITQPVMGNHPISSTAEDWELRHELYKLLKRKTEATSEAREIVDCVGDSNGYEVWRLFGHPVRATGRDEKAEGASRTDDAPEQEVQKHQRESHDNPPGGQTKKDYRDDRRKTSRRRRNGQHLMDVHGRSHQSACHRQGRYGDRGVL